MLLIFGRYFLLFFVIFIKSVDFSDIT